MKQIFHTGPFSDSLTKSISACFNFKCLAKYSFFESQMESRTIQHVTGKLYNTRFFKHITFLFLETSPNE